MQNSVSIHCVIWLIVRAIDFGKAKAVRINPLASITVL